MSEQLLTILKFCLLALIYLFFFRVLRAVWAELTPPKVAPAPVDRARGGRPTAGPAPKSPKASRRTVAGSSTSPHAPLVGRLVVVEPPASRGMTFNLAEEITVGRAPGRQVTVDDTFVSQLHARVFSREGNYLVEDLGSTNGTYLNSKKVSGAMIMQRGDRLQVGNTVLELE